MGAHQGANLVGMSLLLLDACPLSWFTCKKKISLSWCRESFRYLSWRNSPSSLVFK